MPEVLTKKMFGLPRWAWLLILATAIGIGLYLRYKNDEEEETESEFEEAPVGLVGSEAVPVGGYNEVGEGGGYYYGEGGGNFINEGVPLEEGRPETIINIGIPPLPSATDDTAGGAGGSKSSVGATGTPCGQKPTVPTGYKAECVSGKWKIVPKTAAKKPNVYTGGGPPNKPNDKKPSAPKIGIGQAQAVASPVPVKVQHPNAVKTANKCVNGGVGKHQAPAGYHLFCQNGWIWRAPNN